MRETRDIQADLDAAQHDLEKSISDLEHVIEDKLATPKHVIELVERPFAFVRRHAMLFGVGAVFALGLVAGRMLPER